MTPPMPQIQPDAAPVSDSVLQFDHLGVLVKNLNRGRASMRRMLDIKEWSEVFEDTLNGVAVQFGRDGSGVCYELIEPLGADSPVAPTLSSRRAILNHVAYRVGSLDGRAGALRLAGCAPVNQPRPAIAYAGRRIQFFATPLNFVIELIEAPDHQHKLSEQNLADWQRRT